MRIKRGSRCFFHEGLIDNFLCLDGGGGWEGSFQGLFIGHKKIDLRMRTPQKSLKHLLFKEFNSIYRHDVYTYILLIIYI